MEVTEGDPANPTTVAKCLRHTEFQCNGLHKSSAIFAKGVISVEIK